MGVSTNSKEVKNNFIFGALKGKKFDGNNFIQKISSYQNIVVVTENINTGIKLLSEKQRTKLTILHTENSRCLIYEIANFFYSNKIPEKIAVTGTNGKTSVTEYVRQIWENKGILCSSIGTLGIFFKKKKILDNSLTTIEGIQFNKILSKIYKKGCEKLVIEASSIGIDQLRIYPSTFNKVGFTNLTHDHLDYHKNFLNYKKSKGKLFHDYTQKDSYAALNTDDKNFKFFKKLCEKKKIKLLDYGFKAQFLKINKITSIENYKFVEFTLKNKKKELKLKNANTFDIYNKFCAIILVYGLKLNLSNFNEIRFLQSPKGRLEKIHSKDYSIFIDYAHTPDALENILKDLKLSKHRNLFALIGCGGNRDMKKRPQMTKVALKYCDHIILADDNPRFENPSKIREEMLIGVSRIKAKKISNIGNRKKAIEFGLKKLNKNDFFVICGKGHEEYQIIGDKKKKFSDTEVVKQYLKNGII